MNPEVKDKDLLTPLMPAAVTGADECLEWLAEAQKVDRLWWFGPRNIGRKRRSRCLGMCVYIRLFRNIQPAFGRRMSR